MSLIGDTAVVKLWSKAPDVPLPCHLRVHVEYQGALKLKGFCSFSSRSWWSDHRSFSSWPVLLSQLGRSKSSADRQPQPPPPRLHLHVCSDHGKQSKNQVLMSLHISCHDRSSDVVVGGKVHYNIVQLHSWSQLQLITGTQIHLEATRLHLLNKETCL